MIGEAEFWTGIALLMGLTFVLNCIVWEEVQQLKSILRTIERRTRPSGWIDLGTFLQKPWED